MPTATRAPGEARAPDDLLGAHPFGRLPTWLPAARQIVEATAGHGLTALPLVEAIAWDPVVAARVLKLAAAARRGDRPVITTLSAAVARLGPQVTALCALDFSLVPGRDPDLDPHALVWRRSQRTAMVARALALCIDRSLAGTAYACGLMIRIGQLVLLEQDRPGYQARLLKTRGDLEPEEELRLQGVRHQQLTAAVLKSWGLSSRLWQPILETVEREAAPEGPSVLQRPLTLTTDILIVASRVEMLLDRGQHETAVATLCGGQHSARLSDVEAELLLTGIESATRALDGAERPVLSDMASSRLLMSAFERRSQIALQTGQDMQGMAWRVDQLEAQCVQLTEITPRAQRLADSVRHVAVVCGLSLALLASGGVVILLVMYFFKSALGIDLFQDLHLSDLFS